MDNIYNVSPNSHKFKQEQKDETVEKKKVEKVVTGSVKTKKKDNVQKIADVFISEDVANVKSYILMDVLVPAIKKAISDIVTNGIDMVLYGETGHSKSNRTSGSKVSYRSYYDSRNDRRESESSRRNGFDYDNIIFNSRGDAEAVLEALNDLIDQYGMASVGDLYDLADVTTDNYMVEKFGWTSIRTAEPMRTRDGGYILKMPKAMAIKN